MEPQKFIRIPHEFLEKHLAQIGPTNFAVFSVLMKFADFQTGECYPKIDSLCALVGVSRSTVERSLAYLSKINLLTKISGAAKGRRNRYFVSPMTQGYVTHDVGGTSPMTYPNKEELEPLNENHLTKTPPRRQKPTCEGEVLMRVIELHPPQKDLGVRYSKEALAGLYQTGWMTEDLVPQGVAKTYKGFWVA